MEIRSNGNIRARVLAIVVPGLLVLSMAGCATKKMVRQSVDALEAKVNRVDHKVDEKTEQNADAIKDVDQKAQTGIAQAQKTGEDAAQQASKADQAAQGANTLAQQGVTQATQTQQTLEGMDNPQTVKTETVLFGFNRSTLTDADKATLDALQQTVASLKYYSVEVMGYTDKTGPVAYNLDLSRKRADAVVRYLTENDKVPLVKVHVLGYGEDSPAADNHSREGRKENRRVEIKILAPEQQGTATQSSANAPAPSPTASNPQ
ncbi:MAG TPA: OmpA family protein [Terriglobia bacterium]|nr:OmpA family protein [Terriglobia bacterium]